MSLNFLGVSSTSCAGMTVSPDGANFGLSNCTIGAGLFNVSGLKKAFFSYSGDANFQLSANSLPRSVEIDWPFGQFTYPTPTTILPRWHRSRATWTIPVHFSLASVAGLSLSDSDAANLAIRGRMWVRLIDPTAIGTVANGVISGGVCAWNLTTHLYDCSMSTPHGLAENKYYQICVNGSVARTSESAGTAPCELVKFK